MIYLDNAATTLRKPPQVALAMARAVGSCASPGRGVHAPAMRAADVVYSCREEAAKLFHFPSPEKIVFTMNATHGLNTAIRSLVKPGSKTLISGYEHNAVVRPLKALGAEVEIVRGEAFNQDSFLEEFEQKLPAAKVVICTHVSNVFGFRLPVETMSAMCGEYGVPMILDAAQSAGHFPIDCRELNVQFVAMPGHKGLLGPQGTGLLICADTADPVLFGGTGNMSESPDMPEDLPERLEAGTQNVCGIAGLREGLKYVLQAGADQIEERERTLTEALYQGLGSIPGLRLIVVPEEARSCVVSVVPQSMNCEDMAEALGRAGVAVRSGLHCAPLAHRTANTLSTGTVRYSVSSFNAPEEIEKAVWITKRIIKNSYKT